MDRQKKLREDVRKFLDVYKILSPEGKAQFEAQMAGSIKGQPEETQKLYHFLLGAAKDGMGVAQAIEAMKKTEEVRP